MGVYLIKLSENPRAAKTKLIVFLQQHSGHQIVISYYHSSLLPFIHLIFAIMRGKLIIVILLVFVLFYLVG